MKSCLTVRLLTAVAALSCMMAACSKINDTYKGFLKGGEVIYSQLPDSIQLLSGHNRVKLSLFLAPNVLKCKIYWHNRADSITAPVPQTMKDTNIISLIIDNLPEGSYNFEIYTYNTSGNVSLKDNISGRVYGENYINTLSNRQVKDAALIGGNPRIIWYDELNEQAIGEEIRYKDQAGLLHELSIPISDSVTAINESPLGDSIQYRTLFLPDSTVIDTFYTDYQTLKLENAVPKELDKSNFQAMILQSDAVNAWSFPALWDNNTGSTNGFANPTSGFPLWFTMDLGGTTKLTTVRVWGLHDGREYSQANVRHFQVWGSNAPDPDGSFSGWTLLQDCEVVKPSGSPLGVLTDEDRDSAAAGAEFIIPSSAPAVRYIRFKIISSFTPGGGYVWLTEVSFWGIVE